MSVADVLFQTFFQAGFECSTHKNKIGRRLDLLASTGHDCFGRQDLRRLRDIHIRAIRTAARWHLIEETPGSYNFESLRLTLDAADAEEMQVILDVLHFGWPDHIDVLSEEFPHQFGEFTLHLARFLKKRPRRCVMLAPVNEISFLSWAGGDKGTISPFATGRGDEFKRNLVRAAVVSSEILLNEMADVRLIAPEPVIHIVGNPDIPGDVEEAAAYRMAQFQSWDMLSGRMEPELGGRPEYLDIIGMNFYARNEWVHNATVPLERDDPRFRHFHLIIREVWERYKRPMFVSETGTEDDKRADWFNYVCDEVATAIQCGMPVHGICLYPILNHPGWDDDRYCCNGLFDYPDANGNREIYQPLAEALAHQQTRFAPTYEMNYATITRRPDLPFTSPVGVRVSAAPTPDEPLRPRPESLFHRGTDL